MDHFWVKVGGDFLVFYYFRITIKGYFGNDKTSIELFEVEHIAKKYNSQFLMELE